MRFGLSPLFWDDLKRRLIGNFDKGHAGTERRSIQTQTETLLPSFPWCGFVLAEVETSVHFGETLDGR